MAKPRTKPVANVLVVPTTTTDVVPKGSLRPEDVSMVASQVPVVDSMVASQVPAVASMVASQVPAVALMVGSPKPAVALMVGSPRPMAGALMVESPRSFVVSVASLRKTTKSSAKEDETQEQRKEDVIFQSPPLAETFIHDVDFLSLQAG